MNHHLSTPKCTIKKPTSNYCCFKNESRNGYERNESAATRSGENIRSWTKVQNLGHPWDDGMPQFIMTTHHEGCETCNVYTLHIVKASELSMVEIPSREVEKAFRIAWPNIVHHIEDEASSESDKKSRVVQ